MPILKGPMKKPVWAEQVPLQPNTDEAIEFLQSWPAAFPHLCAIHIDPETGEKGRIEAKAFPQPVDWDAVRSWIDERQGKANLYFTVNSLLTPIDKKAAKTDVAEVVALHVDIDVPAGADQEAGAAALVDRVCRHKPMPSVVISSGGGAQAFWVLEPGSRIRIDGDIAAAESAERYTRGLENEFSAERGAVKGKADHCHNVDRVMRLPGTINLPDKAKREKGRVKALAKLVAVTCQQFPITDFQPAGSHKTTGDRETLTIDRDAARALVDTFTIDSLRERGVDEHTLGLLESGDAENKYTGDNSSMLMAIAGGLHRAGLSPEEIAAVLGTTEFPGCAHVKKAKDKWRAIKRAVEKATSDDKAGGDDEKHQGLIAEMNAKYFVAPLGTKTKVVTLGEEAEFPGRQTIVMAQGLDDFRALHSNRKVKQVVKTKDGFRTIKEGIGKWWLNQEGRRQYTAGIKFTPKHDADEVDGRYNTFRGFAVQSRKPEGGSGASGCQLFLEHGRKIICSGNEDHYDYLIKREATIVQKRTRTEIACCYRTEEERTGKGLWVNGLGHLYGQHYMELSDPEHVLGRFNDHLETLLKVGADEALFAGDPRHRNALYGLITEPTMTVEPKFQGKYKADSYLNLDLLSNAKHFIPAGRTAGRFMVPLVSPEKRGDLEYFNAILAQLSDGGYEALLYHLQHEIDIRDYDPRRVPITAQLREQVERNRSGVDAFIAMICNEGRLPYALPAYPSVSVTSGEADGKGFDHWLNHEGPADLRRLGPDMIKADLKEWGCTHWRSRKIIGGSRPHGIEFPPLRALRDIFELKHGAQEWRSQADEWDAPGETDDDRTARGAEERNFGMGLGPDGENLADAYEEAVAKNPGLFRFWSP